MTYLLAWNGHAKMNRKDMWEWCQEGKPDEEYLEILRAEIADVKENYTVHTAVRAAVNCGNLIIGLYDVEDGKTVGLYYMTPSGNHTATKNGKDWYQDKVMYLPLGGYSYYVDTGRIKWYWLDGAYDADAWINESGLDDGFYGTISTNPLRRLDRVEANLSYIRKWNARKRREDRITDWVHEIAYLPDGLMDWVEATVFENRHFAYQDKTAGGKKRNKYHCTACGYVVSGTGWKHGKEYECPLCGATVKVNKTRTWKDQTSRVSYFYPCQNMKGRDRIAMVTLYVTKRWRETGETTSKSAERILLIPTDGSSVDCDEIYYSLGITRWSDRNSSCFQCGAGYLYLPNPSILSGTVYEDMLRPVTAASARGWRLNYDYLMLKNGALKSDLFEYLIKGGYKKLTVDLVQNRNYDGDIRWSGKTVDEVLQIHGQSRARLRAADGNIKYLRWLQTAEVCGYKLSDDLLAWLARNLSPTSVGKILNSSLLPRMSVEKIANYAKKQMKLGANWQRYYGTKAESLIQSWLDYLGMAKTLGLDLSRESVYKPANLKERHDELAEIIAIREREKQARAKAAELRKKAKDMDKKYPGVAPVCEKIKPMYEWSNEEYSVMVPSGAWDIMQEGVLLGHCSSRSDENVYLERVEKETSYIMFLRKNSKKDSPWYTMEVEPGGNVIQLRTYGDDDGTHKYHDRDEAKAALGIWRREIAKRLGQGELTKAKKSREALLKYWDGLKKNGNVIRGGYLKGTPLVDVLQADYKELNGELPKEEVG